VFVKIKRLLNHLIQESDWMTFSEYIYLRPNELKEKIKQFPLAMIPLGALEWHGPHLPLGTDGLKIEYLLRKTAENLEKGGVLFPTKFWGAYRTMKFPWTFNFSRLGQRIFYKNMLKTLYNMGFRIIILLTGHYPESLVKLLMRTSKCFMQMHKECYVLGISEYFLLADFDYYGDHAARWETSFQMAINPDRVDLNELPEGYNFIQRAQYLGIAGQDPLITSSKEEGYKLVEAFSNRLSALIEEIWNSQSQEAFLDVYTNYYKKRAELFKRKNREKGLEVLGWDSMKDLWNTVRWFFKNGLKQVKQKEK
jgi:creatinine amidohydrolase